MKNYAPQETKAPKRLESRIDGENIFVEVICPKSGSCMSKSEINCRYTTKHTDIYKEPKFPVGEIIVTSLSCGELFTIGRDKKGFYIELGDTRSR